MRFIDKIKYIIIHFLYETPIEEINVSSLANELTKLNSMIENFDIETSSSKLDYLNTFEINSENGGNNENNGNNENGGKKTNKTKKNNRIFNKNKINNKKRGTKKTRKNKKKQVIIKNIL
jgi:hypothetical protein